MSANAQSVIGGTSGNPATSGNVLSLNLNGVNLNYDLGPNVSTVANQAQSFVTSSFNADAALLNSAIIGGQNFLGNIANPVIAMAQDQQQFNTTQLPQMFTALANQNYTLGQSAVAAESQVAIADAAASNATAQSASGGGGCYITTAVCETLNLPDDCEPLRILRRYRDRYMKADPARRALVAEYYRTAPAIAAKIKTRKDSREFAERLYCEFIHPAIVSIRRGYYGRALTIYRALIEAARYE